MQLIIEKHVEIGTISGVEIGTISAQIHLLIEKMPRNWYNFFANDLLMQKHVEI